MPRDTVEAPVKASVSADEMPNQGVVLCIICDVCFALVPEWRAQAHADTHSHPEHHGAL